MEEKKEHRKKYLKRYKEENKEKLSEYQKKYRQENKEKYLEYRRKYQKKYQEQNKEKLLEYRRKYMREKRESSKEIPEHPFNYIDYIRIENERKKRSKIPNKLQPLREVHIKREWSV